MSIVGYKVEVTLCFIGLYFSIHARDTLILSMRKFTIFTVVLAAVVILSSLDLITNKYGNSEPSAAEMKLALPRNLDVNKAVQTDVTGAGGTVVDDTTTASDSTMSNAPATTGATDFEDANYAPALPDIYLRSDQVKSAGFVNATIQNETTDDMLFKNIYVGDLVDTEMTKYAIMNKDKPMVKVYVFTMGPNTDINNVYTALKTRAAEGVDSEVNETNTYGTASFYYNDAKRSSTAFLVVEFSNLIYGFSYPKEYNPQVKNLVKLLEWEFKK